MTDDRERALDEALDELRQAVRTAALSGWREVYEWSPGAKDKAYRVRELFRERIPVAQVRKLLLEAMTTEKPPYYLQDGFQRKADAILREHGWETDDGNVD